jgi:hypothetical protein
VPGGVRLLARAPGDFPFVISVVSSTLPPVIPLLRRSLLFLALVAAVAAPAAEAKIVRVFFGWREAASFKRIAEYFDGREHTGGEIVVRTKPDHREGFYFLVRLKQDAPAAGAAFVIHVIFPGSPRAKAFTLPADVPAGETVFNLGLTGADWPSRETHAVAWKIELKDGTGAVLASEKSYLWDNPPES